MPYAQHINAQALGFLVGSSPVTEGMVTQAINSNQISVSYMFVPDQNRTVTSVKIYCPSRGGTGGTLDAQIRTDNNGQPSGTVITGGGTVSSAIPLPPAWVTLSGWSGAVTAGTPYWIYTFNADASPTVNYPNLQFGNYVANRSWSLLAGLAGGFYGWQVRITGNAGSSWSTGINQAMGIRVGYADGTYDGFPFSALGPDADNVYSNLETGVKFTSPNARLNIAGLGMLIGGYGGTPTGKPCFRLYNGTTLLGTTNPAASYPVTGGPGWLKLRLPSVIQLPANTPNIRVTLADSAADASANFYQLRAVSYDTDVNSLGIMPFKGTLQKTRFNGTAWADTLGLAHPFELMLDTNGEAAPAGLVAMFRRSSSALGTRIGSRQVVRS